MLNQLLGCTGSGGSYGGFGGSSSPNNCNLMVSQPPYDNGIWPRSPGSGGGFFMKEISAFSSGGGIINIQCGIISLIGSKLEANGYAGIQSGGGGSGGAIALDYMAISGNGSISCNGGNARSSGGGGRLRLWCHGWKQSPINQNLIMIVVSCMGGLLCSGKYSCGENGSIVTSPCPPGYALNLTTLSCEMCDIGHYQVTFGYSRCLPCGNKPDNSVYKVAEDGQGYSYSQSCIYECLPGML